MKSPISILKVQNIFELFLFSSCLILGINYPAGKDELRKFCLQNPDVHVRSHLIYGRSAVNLFVGERTEQQKHYVDLCYSEFLNYSNSEITGEIFRLTKLNYIFLI